MSNGLADTAVLVLNHNGLPYLDACFESLQEAIGPRKCQVLMIDNASRDGSLEHVRASHPWVRLLANDRNLGFSAAYNAATSQCNAEWVVFLNNDTRVEPDWLAALDRAMVDHPEARFLASRMMSWDGERIDFIGADTFFTGHAWQRNLREPGAGRSFVDTPLLFGCAGALAAHRKTFQDCGGFDPDYFSFFEDVDLGWRAALLGQPTWLAASAVVRHRQHATWSEQPSVQVRYLTERNALATAFKNLHDDRHGVWLLAAAVLTFLRGWYSTDVLRTAGRPFLSSDAVAHLLALAHFRELFHGFAARRAEVQLHRVRTDRAILPLFGDIDSPPHALGEEYRGALGRIRAALDPAGEGLERAYSARLNELAKSSALSLCRVCEAALSPRYGRSFLNAAWEFSWEHPIGVPAAAALRGASDAVLGWLAAPLDEGRTLSVKTALDSLGPAASPPPPSPSTGSTAHSPGTSGTAAVVVRTLDRPEGLRRALGSVAAQTRVPDEVVLVNDGGADPSGVVAEFAARLSIRLVNLPTRVGRTVAAQTGLEAATSEFVCFLDDDDELLPNHLSTLLAAIARDGVRVAYGDVESVHRSDDERQPSSVRVLGGPFDRSRLAFENWIPLMGMLFDRRLALALGGFDTSLDYFEDWDLFLRLARHLRFAYCPVVVARYTVDATAGHGLGLAGAHRWPALAKIFAKHRDAIEGVDFARFYQDQIESLRQRLAAAEAHAADANRILTTIQNSRGWRLYQFARRLVGKR